MNYLSWFLNRKHRRFAHPIDYGHGVIASEIKTRSIQLYKSDCDTPSHTIDYEYQKIYTCRRTYVRCWCPICGFMMTEGPGGCASVSIVCDNCNLNFGSNLVIPPIRFDTIEKIHTQFDDTQSNDFYSKEYLTPIRYRRRPRTEQCFSFRSVRENLGYTRIVENCSEYIAAIFSHWLEHFTKLKPTISLSEHLLNIRVGPNMVLIANEKLYNIIFWNENDFYLCNIIFIPDSSKYARLQNCCIFTSIIENKVFDLCDPKSIEQVESLITKTATKYPKSYYTLLSTSTKVSGQIRPKLDSIK